MNQKVSSLSSLRQVTSDPFDAMVQKPARFDSDAWHAMNERDNRLIEDSIVHGAASDAFIYSFNISGKLVEDISVIGARELVSQYGGIQSRIISSMEKQGEMLIMRNMAPASMQFQIAPELEETPDFYECIIEVKDIKNGNSIQVRKRENKQEARRDGSKYDRPHYDVIAESKAFRNAVLALLPQHVIMEFKERCKKQGKVEVRSKDDLIDAVLRFAVKSGIRVNRNAVSKMTYQQIMGLGEAAKEGLANFKQAAISQGLAETDPDEESQDKPDIAPVHLDAWTMIKDEHNEKGAEAAAAKFAELPKKTQQALEAHFKGLTA